MLATHVAYNSMLHQGSGAIYNMEGLGSDGRRITGLTPYGSSKRAVRYFTDAFAAEVRGILLCRHNQSRHGTDRPDHGADQEGS